MNGWSLKSGLTVVHVLCFQKFSSEPAPAQDDELEAKVHIYIYRYITDKYEQVTRRPAFCVGENKGANQLDSEHAAGHTFVFTAWKYNLSYIYI